MLEKLSDLEDESAAVKVSLIQLLQEKSATNKTLALENCRLTERVCKNLGVALHGERVYSGTSVTQTRWDSHYSFV